MDLILIKNHIAKITNYCPFMQNTCLKSNVVIVLKLCKILSRILVLINYFQFY